MSWHYQILRKSGPLGYEYGITRSYTNPSGWCDEYALPIGDSQDELIRDLELMLADAKKYPILDGLTGTPIPGTEAKQP